ncbi:MOSC domain-containing protein [Pullulanibacillus sp. KACC 23026]|uniref:MOSC domain-containing protein n=1 Tax=Pullulanibacillus sp. KACC 23026 TaxID=3028315 RepID=UPI0023B03A20|nr:MOSC domain-containing protein [Pullulanibacillus sp. KACC 23026]WEG11970.1 MOSC domain-containing protein [Pullulanibacillus sp. KACC 23026]
MSLSDGQVQPNLKVKAILVGEPKDLSDGQGHVVRSAINKTVVSHPIFLTTTHFIGDRQADQKNHGGVDKAVLGYSFDHYAFWEEKLGQPIEYGAFGENLTFSGLSESTINIGDTFQLDEAVIQVSQPRKPCFKLAYKHRVKAMPLWVEETGKSGIYFRVLKEGWVTPEPKFTLLHKGSGSMTLEKINRALVSKPIQMEGLKSVLAEEGLAQSLKDYLISKIAKEEARR